MSDKKNEHLLFNRKKWDIRARDFDKKTFDYFRVFQKRVIDLMDPKPGSHILDLGCGTGWALDYAFEKCRHRGVFTGMDLSPEMIRRACARDKKKELHFVTGDAHYLEFNNNTFDNVLCTNSFHHYANPLKVLKEVSRILKPHGMFYLLDLRCDGPLMRVVNRRLQRTEKEHVSFYSKSEIKDFFSRAGLRLMKSRYLYWFLRLDIGQKENY